MHDITIVVTTSKKYRELIDGFIYFFNKFWSECKFEVIIILEDEKRENFDNFRFLLLDQMIGQKGYMIA